MLNRPWIPLLSLLALAVTPNGEAPLAPVRETSPVPGDADDPAIWIHPTDRSKSLIVGTDKVEIGKGGGLYVFGLDGKLRQGPLKLDRPNNVDIEQHVRLGSETWDVAVAAERGKCRLAIFRIDARSGRLWDATGRTAVFEGETGDRGAPMGIALYRRPRDGALFAIVSRKEGPTEGYLAQYRLVPGAKGKVDAKFVRSFGKCQEGGEIEALLVDDALGWVYAAEEKYGIRKYAADPEASDANRERAVFGRTGFPADREGLGLYATGPKIGFLLCSDQRDGGSFLRIFPREGTDHPELGAVATDADGTDGIEATAIGLGTPFGKGMVAMMNSRGRNFRLYRWEAIAHAAGLSGKRPGARP